MQWWLCNATVWPCRNHHFCDGRCVLSFQIIIYFIFIVAVLERLSVVERMIKLWNLVDGVGIGFIIYESKLRLRGGQVR